MKALKSVGHEKVLQLPIKIHDLVNQSLRTSPDTTFESSKGESEREGKRRFSSRLYMNPLIRDKQDI